MREQIPVGRFLFRILRWNGGFLKVLKNGFAFLVLLSLQLTLLLVILRPHSE